MNLFLKKRRGATLVTVLVLAMVVSTMLFGMYLMFQNNSTGITSQKDSKYLFYYAKSGIEIAESALNSTDSAGVKIIYDDLKDGTRAKPLIDIITKNEITEMPENIKIYTYIDYITEEKILHPPSETGVPDAPVDTFRDEDIDEASTYYIDEKKDMFIIISKAKKIGQDETGADVVEESHILVEYIDPKGVNSSFE